MDGKVEYRTCDSILRQRLCLQEGGAGEGESSEKARRGAVGSHQTLGVG
jgi:hypothetical protein